jgi:hypothetical protein
MEVGGGLLVNNEEDGWPRGEEKRSDGVHGGIRTIWFVHDAPAAGPPRLMPCQEGRKRASAAIRLGWTTSEYPVYKHPCLQLLMNYPFD